MYHSSVERNDPFLFAMCIISEMPVLALTSETVSIKTLGEEVGAVATVCPGLTK